MIHTTGLNGHKHALWVMMATPTERRAQKSLPSGRVVNFQRFHEIANTTEIAVQQARKPGYGGVFRQPHDYCFKSAAASGGLGISTSYLLGLVPTVKYIHTF